MGALPSWDETEPLNMGALPSWDETEPVTPARKTSYDVLKDDLNTAKDFARMAVQGGSLGFSDELAGAAGVAVNPFSKNYKDTYESYRDIERAKIEKARRDSPIAAPAGEITGGVMSALVPGAGILNAGRGAGLVANIGKGMLSGAVAGVGTSDAKNLRGNIDDALTGATFGGMTGGALNLAGKAVKGIVKAPEFINEGLLNTPRHLTQRYMEEGVEAAKKGVPNPLLNAEPRYKIAQDIIGEKGIGQLKKEVIEGSQNSREILEKEGKSFSRNEIAQIYLDEAKKIKDRSEGAITDKGKLAAYNWLLDSAKTIKANKKDPIKNWSTNRVKDEVQTLQQSTNWEIKPGNFAKIDDITRQNVEKNVNKLLKSTSDDYKMAMDATSRDTDLLNRVRTISKSPQGWSNIFRRIETDQYGSGQLPRDTLAEFDKRLGTNYLKRAERAHIAEAFDKSLTNGSMNVNKFSVFLQDVPGFKYVAPFVGVMVDKVGRKMSQNVTEGFIKINTFADKYGVKKAAELSRPLVDQARSGNVTAALTMQLLIERYPEEFSRYKNELEGE